MKEKYKLQEEKLFFIISIFSVLAILVLIPIFAKKLIPSSLNSVFLILSALLIFSLGKYLDEKSQTKNEVKKKKRLLNFIKKHLNTAQFKLTYNILILEHPEFDNFSKFPFLETETDFWKYVNEKVLDTNLDDKTVEIVFNLESNLKSLNRDLFLFDKDMVNKDIFKNEMYKNLVLASLNIEIFFDYTNSNKIDKDELVRKYKISYKLGKFQDEGKHAEFTKLVNSSKILEKYKRFYKDGWLDYENQNK